MGRCALAGTWSALPGACAAGTTQESTGEYVNDSVCAGTLKAAFVGEPALKAADIHVATCTGSLQLRAFVSLPDSVRQRSALARTVGSVTSVMGALVVK